MSDNVWINRVLSIFKDIDKIFVFGAGNYGKDLEIILNKYELFDKYIDNEKVISLKEYLLTKKKNYIVIAASYENIINISEQLKNNGLILNKGIKYETIKKSTVYKRFEKSIM